jgi:hypothetical protein
MRRDSRIVRAIAVAAVLLARAPFCWAQGQPLPDDSGTSTDLFVMLGPDLDPDLQQERITTSESATRLAF